MTPKQTELEDLEIRLLLEGVFRHYGFDFRDYAPASLKRRVWKCVHDEKLSTISGFQEKVLHDPGCLERFLLTLSINVTAMFRDPSFYRAFREKVVPRLRTYPFVRIWHVGCAAGQEVYSMAILLQEEGLYDRCRLYATDMNEVVLQKAKAGIFSLNVMREYTDNYLKAGGRRAFSEYYTAKYENAILRPALQANIIWSPHNVVTDTCFNEFNVILCRNVLIYFNEALQARVHKLLYESLAIFGVLGLGSKESIQFTPYATHYENVDQHQKLYRKIK